MYRGKARVPLDGWWKRSRHAILVEVKLLRNLLRAKLSSNAHTPSREELISTVLSTIKENESEFPNLIRIDNAFVTFLFSNLVNLKRLLERELSPADFTGELIQWATNYKPESARQIISSSHKQTRRRSDS